MTRTLHPLTTQQLLQLAARYDLMLRVDTNRETGDRELQVSARERGRPQNVLRGYSAPLDPRVDMFADQLADRIERAVGEVHHALLSRGPLA